MFVFYDMCVVEIDKVSWVDYIKVENNIFDEVCINVIEKLEFSIQVLLNCYYFGSLIYLFYFKNDWNCFYIL